MRRHSLSAPLGDVQKVAQALHFSRKLTTKTAFSWIRSHVTALALQFPVHHGCVRPSNHVVAPQHRQRVVPELPLGRRRIRFEPVRPSPEQLKAPAIPYKRIEGSEQTHYLRS